jgi:uroporphyrinogen-III synthase
MTSVLVVRKHDAFSRTLEESGFEVVNCPATETKAIGGPLRVARETEGIFVTSRAAAEIIGNTDGLRARIYVLGRSSYEVLKGAKLDLWYCEAANTAGEMLDRIPRGELEGKRLLFVCGDRSLPTIPDRLEGIATVERAVVYRTTPVRVDCRQIDRAFDWICFFSPSGIESFIDQAGVEFLDRSRIAAIGPTTADCLKRQGRVADLVATHSNARDFARDLIEKGEG